MNFRQIEDSLPNGFHDSFLKTVTVDYSNRTAKFEMEVWVGGSENSDTMEYYRGIRIELQGLLMCVLDVPNQEFLEDKSVGMKTDSAPIDYMHCWPLPTELIPVDAFTGCLYFTAEANSAVTFVAANAIFEWLTEARRIYW